MKRKTILILFSVLLVIFGLSVFYNWYKGQTAQSVLDTSSVTNGDKVAYFAGGCFWCTESDFEKLVGVDDVVSGYMGGNVDSPAYEEVASGTTGHRESVKVVYNPNRVSYRSLVLNLLSHTDPTDAGGTFFDRGKQYTTAVYYQTEEEKNIAESVIKELTDRKIFNKPIVTSVEPAGKFWIAEDYHQDFYKKNPVRYNYYRTGSGRDAFIESVWGNGKNNDLFDEGMNMAFWKNYVKPGDDVLKQILTPIQYEVTQQDGTEVAFDNEYWNNHEEGIYVDILSGEPLFSSTDKFESGTGWPSFLKPIDKNFVKERPDYKLIVPRTEVRSIYSDSHLGHIILDGPASNNNIRYCMNSAALRFVPKDEMQKDGYGDFLYLFE